MNTAIQQINKFFKTLPARVRARRLAVVLLFVLATLFLAFGSKNVVIDESLTAYFHEDDPVKQAYDQFRGVFGGDEYLFVIYRAKDGDIFSDRSVKALKRLHHSLADYRLDLAPDAVSPLDHIEEVKSLINVKYMAAGEGTLYSRSFIGDRLPKDPAMGEAYRKKALAHPDFPRVYLSRDCQYGGIVIRTDFNARKKGWETIKPDTAANRPAMADPMAELDDLVALDQTGADPMTLDTGTGTKAGPELIQTDIREYPKFMAAIRAVLEDPAHSGTLEFYPVGNPALMDFFTQAVIEDMGRLMSLVLGLIVVMLWLLFRSFSAVVWPVTIVILTIAWIMGLIGWLGIPMSAMLQVIIFLSLSVGIADSVHILSGYLFFRNQGLAHEPALAAVMEKSGLACLLTSVTTAAGLFALTLVPLKPIASFGLFAAVAVMLAFFLTICLLPLMLDLWAPVSRARTGNGTHPVQQLLVRCESVGTHRSRTVIAIFAAAGCVLFYGLLHLKIDSNFVEIIKKGLPLRDAYTLVDQKMGGTGNLEVMLDFNQVDALKDPKVLNAMAAVQAFMENHPGSPVVKTYSLVNVVKESYKALNSDRSEFYTIPQDPLMLSQVLFLFENANPKDRARLVTDDYTRARIGLNAVNQGSRESLALLSAIQDFMDQEFASLYDSYPDLRVTLTGHMALLTIMLDYIAWAQVKSFGLALVVISGLLFLVLGSYKAGLLALAPNLFPILAAFGLMGFLKVPLDADTLLIAPIIIGLAVDDTIHFLTHFRIEMHRHRHIVRAAKAAVREAGQAIAFTSVILSVGFAVFVLSFHNGLSRFGIFAAIAIIAALMSDIFLLPALCRLARLDFNIKPETGLPCQTGLTRSAQ